VFGVGVRIAFGVFCLCFSLGRRGAALWVVPNKERAQGNGFAHGWALWGSQATHELTQVALKFDDNSLH
jgi:hypothetical protein